MPLLDDIADPLATLLDWKDKSPTQVRIALKKSLDDAVAFLEARRDAGTSGATVALAGVADKLQSAALASIADGLTERLRELRTAVEAGNVAGTAAAVTAANGFLDQYDTLRTTLDSEVLAHLAGARSALKTLPGELEDQIGLVVSGLTSPPGTSVLDQATARLDSLGSPDAVTEVTEGLGTIVAWLQDLIAKLDLSAVEGPLKAAADGARSALDGVEEGLTEATLAIQNAFTTSSRSSTPSTRPRSRATSSRPSRASWTSSWDSSRRCSRRYAMRSTAPSGESTPLSTRSIRPTSSRPSTTCSTRSSVSCRDREVAAAIADIKEGVQGGERRAAAGVVRADRRRGDQGHRGGRAGAEVD